MNPSISFRLYFTLTESLRFTTFNKQAIHTIGRKWTHLYPNPVNGKLNSLKKIDSL